MKASIIFSKEDLLTNFLFVASKSERVKRTKIRTWVGLVICCVIFAFNFYLGESEFWMWYFIILGIGLLLFFPLISKLIYKRQYNKFAADRFKNLNGSPFNITFTAEHIAYQSDHGDVLLKKSQIETIYETKDYFFVKFQSQDTVTLPKRSFDYEELNNYLTGIATDNGIPIHRELDWKWR